LVFMISDFDPLHNTVIVKNMLALSDADVSLRDKLFKTYAA